MTSSIPEQKLSTGFTLPKIGFGTWRMGRGREYGPTENDEIERKAIRQAVDKGMVHVDTAEMYGAGYVEELVGQALNDVPRESYFLTSKVAGFNASYDGVRKAIAQSLKRLKVDYLDLYLIHWRDLDVDLEGGIKAMSELVDQGLIKNIGVSNFAPKTLAQAQSFTSHKIVCDQVQYSLQHREAEANGLVDYCQQNDVVLVAWGPVLNIKPETSEIPIVKEMMTKYGLTTAQLALSWVMSQDKVCTLAKTTNLDHLEENIKASEIVLDKVDIERLRTEYPGQVFENPGFPMQ